MRSRAVLMILLAILAATSCRRDSIGESSRDGISPDGSPADLALQLTLVERGDAPRPSSLVLRVHNPTDLQRSFIEPVPVSYGVPLPKDSTALALALRDDSGRVREEGPLLTSPIPLIGVGANRITLEPDEEWSRSYPLDLFYFWGPCGPSRPLPHEFEKVGGHRVFASARLVSTEGVEYESNFVELDGRLGGWVFKASELYPDVEAVHDFLSRADSVPRLDVGDLVGSPLEDFRTADSILRDLRSPRLETRMSAVHSVLRLSEDERPAAAETVVSLLAEYLENATNDRDRLAALFGLEIFSSELTGEATTAVEGALDSSHVLVRARARELLDAHSSPPPGTGSSSDARDDEQIEKWIMRLARQERPSSRADQEADREAMRQLVRLGERAVPQLLDAWRRADDVVARKYGTVLAYMHKAGLIPIERLEEFLRAGSVSLRRRVPQIVKPPLTSFPDHDRILRNSEAILVALARDSEASVRQAAVSSLASYGMTDRDQVASILVQSLHDPSANVRVAAVRALARSGSLAPEVLREIRSLTDDPHASVRAAARISLVSHGVAPSEAGTLTHAARASYVAALQEETIESVPSHAMPLPFERAGKVIFIVDQSSSSGAGVALAGRLIPRLLESLDENVRFGLVLSDVGVMRIPGDGRLLAVTAENLVRVERALDAVESRPGSCPLAAYEAALDLVRGSSTGEAAILYIGDGGSLCPGWRHEFYLEEFLERIRQENDSECALHAIGIAGRSGLNEDWLYYLATTTGGTYTRVAVREDAGADEN